MCSGATRCYTRIKDSVRTSYLRKRETIFRRFEKLMTVNFYFFPSGFQVLQSGVNSAAVLTFLVTV